MSIQLVLFYSFAFLALSSAVAMVAFVRNVVAGALSLVVTMLSLAGIYVLLEAHLVAAIQIMVYAGAILVLFLFVIMLLNLREDAFSPARTGQALLKGLGIGAVLMGLALLIGQLPPFAVFGTAPSGFGGFRQIGVALYTEFVVPVEMAGLLLLAAIVGAVVLAKRGPVE